MEQKAIYNFQWIYKFYNLQRSGKYDYQSLKDIWIGSFLLDGIEGDILSVATVSLLSKLLTLVISFCYVTSFPSPNIDNWTGNVCVHSCLVAQSCLILCNPMDSSPLGSSVHEICQEWVAIPFSSGSSWPRDQIWVFCIAFFTNQATRGALECISELNKSTFFFPENLTKIQQKHN